MLNIRVQPPDLGRRRVRPPGTKISRYNQFMAPEHPSLRANAPDPPEPREPAEDVTPWDERPRRRVATTLGTARGTPRPRESGDDDGPDVSIAFREDPEPADDDSTGRARPRSPTFKPLRPLFGRQGTLSHVLFTNVALFVAGVTAVAVHLGRVTSVELPSILEAISPSLLDYVPAALVGLLVLSVYAAGAAIATPFAGALAAVGAGWLLATSPEDVDLQSLVVAATLGTSLVWWRSGNWFVGFTTGLVVGAATLVEPLASLTAVLPLVVIVGAWPLRRPLAGAATVAAPLAGMLLAAVAGFVRVGPTQLIDYATAGAGRLMEELQVVPDVYEWPRELLLVVAIALAGLAVRRVMAFLLMLAAIACVAVLPGFSGWQGVFAVGLAVVAAVCVERRGGWIARIVGPVAIGAVVILLLLAQARSVTDPTEHIASLQRAQVIADAVGDDTVIVSTMADPTLVNALKHHVTVRQFNQFDGNLGVEPTYLLTTELDRRRQERQVLGQQRDVRREVALRLDDVHGSGRSWVLIRFIGTDGALADQRGR